MQQSDMNARAHSIQANLHLVVKLACDYSHHGIDLADIIEEGNTGLIYTVDKFDVTKGGAFLPMQCSGSVSLSNKVLLIKVL